MSGKAPRYSNWFSNEIGGRNWVLAARKTDALVRRYGSDVIVVRSKQSRELQVKYHRLYGHPYDRKRQVLYQALLAIRNEDERNKSIGGLGKQLRDLIDRTLEDDIQSN